MRKTSTRLPEQGTQTPPPAPDLIPAKTENQPRTHIGTGTANGGTSLQPPAAETRPEKIITVIPVYNTKQLSAFFRNVVLTAVLVRVVPTERRNGRHIELVPPNAHAAAICFHPRASWGRAILPHLPITCRIVDVQPTTSVRFPTTYRRLGTAGHLSI